MDAVPGKHNIFRLEPLRSGVYYGICAELCGVNHSYIPIVVEVLPYKAFKKWEILTALIVKYGKGRYTG